MVELWFEKLHVVLAGRFEQEKVTDPEKPFSGSIVMFVLLLVELIVAVSAVVLAESVKPD